ncbi:MAG: sarcosine oxidase, gamma subunit [Paracoccaceae bacterium]|nr:sarcosine oxidase, gamma subunit [Paracoccaceae bacterium]MDH5528859.1 sarcosine oxidase, gamma subunit [Paracoccaceae bacterium]
MPEHRLTALSPLGGDAPKVDSFEVFTICENPDLALASLASRVGKGAAFAKAAKKHFGFEMPEPGKTAQKSPYAAIWVGPEQWLIEAPFSDHEDIAVELKHAFDDSASVTEQTDGWARFDVEGPVTGAVFERLCALNVGGMASNSASRTAIEHLGCIVICREAGIRYSVLCPRSGAASLHHALITAAKSAV